MLTYICIHVYISIYICIVACMHVSSRASPVGVCCICVRALSHTYIHTYMHACIHAYMHTCIHTCMHAYIHKYKNTKIQLRAFDFAAGRRTTARTRSACVPAGAAGSGCPGPVRRGRGHSGRACRSRSGPPPGRRGTAPHPTAHTHIFTTHTYTQICF